MKPDNSVTPHISLALFEPVPQCWSSEGVSPSVSRSMHKLFKRNIWNSRSPMSHSATIAAGFHSQKMWGLLFPALKHLTGEHGVGLGPHAPQGRTSAVELSLLIFNYYTWMWGQSIQCLSPPPSGSGFFCVFLVIGLQLGFRQFSRMVVLQFSCNFEVVWKNASTAFAYSAILIRNPSYPFTISFPKHNHFTNEEGQEGSTNAQRHRYVELFGMDYGNLFFFLKIYQLLSEISRC